MKINKHISKILLTGILINNLSILSNAGTLSPDTRYETFEGSSIKIDDILEEEKVDVEIEGNTLVNLLENIEWMPRDTYLYNKSLNYSISGKTITIINLSDKTIDLSLNNGNVEGFNGQHSRSISIPGKSYVVESIPSSECLRTFVAHASAGWNQDNDARELMNKLVVLEGTYNDDTIPKEYFEGLKSAGENDKDGHKVEVSIENGNLWKGKKIYYASNSKFIEASDNEVIFDSAAVNQGIKFNIQRFKNKKISLSYDMEVLSGNVLNFGGHNRHADLGMYVDGVKVNTSYHSGYPNNYEKGRKYRIEVILGINNDVGENKGDYQLRDRGEIGIEPNRYSEANPQTCRIKVSNFVLKEIEEYKEPTKYFQPKSDKKEILLNEPLRGLPNGVKDRIIKRNGQWVIERNIEEIVLNGSEHWYIDVDRSNSETNYFRTHDFVRENESFDVEYNRKTDFYLNDKYIQNTAQNNWYLIDLEKPNLDVNKGKVVSIREGKLTLDEFKNKLKSNPVAVVCQLVKPYYEPLNIDSSINLYEGTTHISNNSTIPASMKVTIDRVANRAKEFSEAAKLNPTSENIALARMWVNLMNESILKDQFQKDISNIADISDIALERKSVSSNLDIYIKSKNMLSMSLNTNSITFDSYSGTEDMEMLGAINISINSSLPYSLNAYMSTEISNTDKSETLPMDILNIKESNETAYQTFDNTVNKLILKDNCVEGNGLVHNIDLKLASSLAHKADVYKTVVKFEAEQK